MSYEKLISMGAEAVGGIVFLKHVKVGAFTSSGFEINEEGRIAVDGDSLGADILAPAAGAPRTPRARKAAADVSDAVVTGQSDAPAADAPAADVLPD